LPGNPKMSEAEHGLTGKHSTLMLASHVPVFAGKNVKPPVTPSKS
jgi:hypothetical protein